MNTNGTQIVVYFKNRIKTVEKYCIISYISPNKISLHSIVSLNDLKANFK